MKASALLLLAAALCLAGCDEEQAAIARRAPAWPGYMQAEQCLPFAQAAAAELSLRGVPARIIGFRYFARAPYATAGGITYAETTRSVDHVVVMYPDAAGDWYAFDNLNTLPVWVEARGKENSGDWLSRIRVMYPSAYEIVRSAR